MTWILQQLLDFLSQLVCWIMTALVLTLNLLLAALGGLLEAAIELLPDMPEGIPTVPAKVTEVVGWINWFFPVSTAAQILSFLLAAWILWQAVALLLRWAKATAE